MTIVKAGRYDERGRKDERFAASSLNPATPMSNISFACCMSVLRTYSSSVFKLDAAILAKIYKSKKMIATYSAKLAS